MPEKSFRTTLQQELTSERDQKELLAADLPAEKVPQPPGPAGAPAPQPPAATQPASTVAGTTPQPGPAAPESPAADTSANATLSAAEATAPTPQKAAEAAALPPPSDAALQIVGEPEEAKNLPLVPDGPPPPATFEGMPAQPAPTPRLLPPHLRTPTGTGIYFGQGSDKLTQSQIDSIKDVASHRKAQTILVTGLGEADSDTPFGQEAALELAVRRARAVVQTLAALHVPQSAMHIAAQPFGRGAVVTLIQ